LNKKISFNARPHTDNNGGTIKPGVMDSGNKALLRREGQIEVSQHQVFQIRIFKWDFCHFGRVSKYFLQCKDYSYLLINMATALNSKFDPWKILEKIDSSASISERVELRKKMGDELRLWRFKSRVTLDRLAKESGTTKQSLSQVESGMFRIHNEWLEAYIKLCSIPT
jgi:DNA-binding XRE family transcriptional regulator